MKCYHDQVHSFSPTIICPKFSTFQYLRKTEGTSSVLWLSCIHNLTRVRFTGQQHLILVTAVSQESPEETM